MRMQIDQSWQQRGSAQADHFRSLGHGQVFPTSAIFSPTTRTIAGEIAAPSATIEEGTGFNNRDGACR